MRLTPALLAVLLLWALAAGCSSESQPLVPALEDAAATDARADDAAGLDRGLRLDAGQRDSGPADSGRLDAADRDADNLDLGGLDARPTDAARPDALGADAEPGDAERLDALVAADFAGPATDDAFVDDGRCEGVADGTMAFNACHSRCHESAFCDRYCLGTRERVTCIDGQAQLQVFANFICPDLPWLLEVLPEDGQSCSPDGQVCAFGECGPTCGNGRFEPQHGEDCDDADLDPIDGCVACVRTQTENCNPACDPDGTAPQADYTLVDELLLPMGLEHTLMASGDAALVALNGPGDQNEMRRLGVHVIQRGEDGRWSVVLGQIADAQFAPPDTSLRAEMSHGVAVVGWKNRAAACSDPNLAYIFERGPGSQWHYSRPISAPVGVDCSLTSMNLAVFDSMIVLSLNRAISDERNTPGVLLIYESGEGRGWVETARFEPLEKLPAVRAFDRPSIGETISVSGDLIVASCTFCGAGEAAPSLKSPLFIGRDGEHGWQLVQDAPPLAGATFAGAIAASSDRVWLGVNASEQVNLRSLNRPLWELRELPRSEAGTWSVGQGVLQLPMAEPGQSSPTALSVGEQGMAASMGISNAVALFGRSSGGRWKREILLTSDAELRFRPSAQVVDDGILVLVDHLDESGLITSTSLRHYRRTLRPACDAQGACICKPGWSGERCQIAP